MCARIKERRISNIQPLNVSEESVGCSNAFEFGALGRRIRKSPNPTEILIPKIPRVRTAILKAADPVFLSRVKLRCRSVRDYIAISSNALDRLIRLLYPSIFKIQFVFSMLSVAAGNRAGESFWIKETENYVKRI